MKAAGLVRTCRPTLSMLWPKTNHCVSEEPRDLASADLPPWPSIYTTSHSALAGLSIWPDPGMRRRLGRHRIPNPARAPVPWESWKIRLQRGKEACSRQKSVAPSLLATAKRIRFIYASLQQH